MLTLTLPEDKVIPVAKRIFWLAYQASKNLGMGFLQAKKDATEEDVWGNICVQGDYPSMGHIPPGRWHADYVFGRMMKITIEHDGTTLKLSDNVPNIEYQSWCREYHTYLALVNKALDECGCATK